MELFGWKRGRKVGDLARAKKQAFAAPSRPPGGLNSQHVTKPTRDHSQESHKHQRITIEKPTAYETPSGIEVGHLF